MYTDSTGTSWWSDFWNSTVGKVVGTILVVAGVILLTVLTAGIGTAVTAAIGGFWGAVAGGAVGGAISGAIFGAGISMATQGIGNGYANIDYGAVRMSALVGAVTGAITGGTLGGIKYARVANYLKSNGASAEQIKQTMSSFKGTPSLKTSKGIKAIRYYDGINAMQKGRYLTNLPTANPIRDLVLHNNLATMNSGFIIENGAKYLVGTIAGSPVNAIQYFVVNLNWLVLLV